MTEWIPENNWSGIIHIVRDGRYGLSRISFIPVRTLPSLCIVWLDVGSWLIHQSVCRKMIKSAESKNYLRWDSMAQRCGFINPRRWLIKPLRWAGFITGCLHDKTEFLHVFLRGFYRNEIGCAVCRIPMNLFDRFFQGFIFWRLKRRL